MRILIILLILFAIDLYVFTGFRHLVRGINPAWIRQLVLVYWAVSAFCLGIIIMGALVDWHTWPKPLRTYSFAFVFVIYFSKLFFVLFLLMDDLLRLFRWGYSRLASPSGSGSISGGNPGGISRLDFLVKTGAFIAAIPFVALIVGMFRGKYAYRVHRKKIAFAKLPDSFHGFRIVQVSDIHSGSFMDGAPLTRAIEIVNELKPDVIFFTGDLVNDRHQEVLPYLDILGKLKANHGIYSILGNHDYGDYYQWESAAAKHKNLEALIGVHRQLGWQILLDEHRHIEKEGERITVIGVQNWSARMNFARYGDLSKALHNISFSPVNILLSHDPSHWRAEVLGKVREIDLTLSGHTHGFQFGVEIPGFKWSPVQYVYHEWADLYSEKKQHLYVNRGLGFLGYPGRVGILPEITLIELEKG